MENGWPMRDTGRNSHLRKYFVSMSNGAKDDVLTQTENFAIDLDVSKGKRANYQ